MIPAVNKETLAHALELIKGTYDLHIHPNPSHFKRKFDDFDVIHELDEVGMAGAVIKTHYESTAGRALIANKYARGKAKVFGSIALNYPLGGLNPYAVESALNMGAKMVWMPTRDSVQHLKMGLQEGDFYEREGISIFDKAGNVKKEVYEILEIIKKYNLAVSTGHLTAEETLALCKITQEQKIRTIVTHPDWPRTQIPMETQLECVKMGAVIERLWAMIGDDFISPEEMAHAIRQVGVENTILGTDSAHPESLGPKDGNLAFIEILIQQGFHDNEIKHMARDLPGSLINEL